MRIDSTTLTSLVADHAERDATKPALVTATGRVSYGELSERVRASAERLQQAGVRRGDRVMLAATSSKPGFVFGYLAVHALGAVAIPVDPRLPRDRLKLIYDLVDPIQAFLPKPVDVFPSQCVDLFETDDCPSEFQLGDQNMDDVSDIVFTTGTTGRPKGVVLTHRNTMSAAQNINEFIGTSGNDREVVPLPLSHSFGLGRVRCNLAVGGTLVLVNGFTFPSRVFDALESWEATGFASVPAGISILMNADPQRLCALAGQLRYIEIGSSPMGLKDKRKLLDLLPTTRICMHYGLTEASRSAFLEFHESRERLESIGKATPNVEIRIDDAEWKEVPSETMGNIDIRGGQVFTEYWRDPGNTSKVWRDGWFRSGDMGWQDGDGYLYLAAREEEIINVGGRKVSPLEIESILVDHPKVKDCACVGIPDPKGVTGDAVLAFVVSDSSSENRPSHGELVSYLLEGVEPYKVPGSFVWVAELPKTASGKLLRLQLRNNWISGEAGRVES